MSELSFVVDDKEWKIKIKKLTKNVKDKIALLNSAFSVAGYKDVIQHFRDEKGPDGKWKKRSAFTNKMYDEIASGKRPPPIGTPRGAYSSSNKILQLTGNLRKTLSPTDTKSSGSDKIVFFSSTKYSGQHDEGLNGLPKRKFMWLSGKAKDLMAEIIAFNVNKD